MGRGLNKKEVLEEEVLQGGEIYIKNVPVCLINL